MKRQLIVFGLAMFALLLFVSISATLAAPRNIPLLQTSETEPNDSCSEANEIALAASVQGTINPITDTDWFSVTTQSGVPYIARASVGPAEFSIRLCVHTSNCAEMYCSSASTSYIEQSWDATDYVHYLKIEKFGSALITETTSYVLDVVEEYVPPPTNTPTDTPTPTSTPLPTNTPSPVTEEDNYEQNDSFDGAYTLPVATSVTLADLAGVANFYPLGDPDWFKFWAKSGKWYLATTSGLSGVDTFVEIRDQSNNVVTGDDDGGGGYASQAEWKANYDGYYYIYIINKVNTTGDYNLTVEEVDAPSTEPTSTPAPTPTNPEADRCDKIWAGNHDFDNACVISVNVSEEFNFSPPPYGGPDNDFFKIWVKPGFIFECATSNLDPGVDPNMIMFSGPSWDDAIAGNDDIEPGDYNSALSYYATYEGWLYVLVGTGDRTPTDVYNSDYTLRCDVHTPGQTSTPAPTNTPAPTATPGSQTATPTPTGSPTATPTPAEGLTVRPLTTPTPVAATTPAPRFIPIRLLVYYDANDDHQPGAGEGIAGISAQAYEVATNQLLAQGFTDEQGNLEFTVAAQGPVRVSVPFFGFSQLAAGEGASIYLRIPSQPLPGGAP